MTTTYHLEVRVIIEGEEPPSYADVIAEVQALINDREDHNLRVIVEVKKPLPWPSPRHYEGAKWVEVTYTNNHEWRTPCEFRDGKIIRKPAYISG